MFPEWQQIVENPSLTCFLFPCVVVCSWACLAEVWGWLQVWRSQVSVAPLQHHVFGEVIARDLYVVRHLVCMITTTQASSCPSLLRGPQSGCIQFHQMKPWMIDCPVVRVSEKIGGRVVPIAELVVDVDWQLHQEQRQQLFREPPHQEVPTLAPL